jgi:O-antigen/teichoic acid export membrane protein
VALASVQIDRLLAGAFLSLEQSGVYFRHVFLAVAAYQAAGVLSHNRIIPRLYRYVQAGAVGDALSLIRRERLRFMALTTGVVVVLIGLEFMRERGAAWLQFLDTGLVVPMVLAYMIRGVADYNALFLNARFEERSVLRAQAFAVLCAMSVSAALAPLLAGKGLVAGAATGAVTYLFVTWRCVRRSLVSAGPGT